MDFKVWKNSLASLPDLSKRSQKVCDAFRKTKQIKNTELLLTTRKINNCGGTLNI